MRSTSFLLAFVLAAIVFSSCNRNHVSLESTNAKGEVPQLGNLVFRFNKALYPDSLLNNWDSTEYISFSPKIPGRFRWKGPDELVFSPSEPLLPATTYKGEVNKNILRFSKYDNIKDGDFKFSTAPLQLTDAQVMWVLEDEGARKAVPQITLQFNYPVKADDIKDRLKIEVEGNPVHFQPANIGVGSSFSVKLEQFKDEDRNYDVRITLNKGLKPEKGLNATSDPISTVLSMPSRYVLNVNNVEADYDGTQGVVHIYTSQQLNGEEVSKYITFEPAVKYTVNYEEYGVSLRSDQFDPESGYTMTINTGLRGVIGGVLKEPFNTGVAFGQLESDITFTSSKAVYLSKKGGGNIEVRITNTPKVKVIISKIYENNLLMAHRYGYYPDGGYDEYSEYDGYEDYAGYRAEAVAGDVVFEKVIDTRSLPKSGGGRLLDISQFQDELADVKGIYHVMVRSMDQYWTRDSRFISFSDIGLIARQAQDKIYVFANSIKTAKPLSGVTVNIYGANNQLLGTAATNEDGAAEVAVNVRAFSGYKPAMVIAKTEDDFTYLPFNNTRVNTSRFEVGGKRSNQTGLDAYIYAERDIYRPGEDVNFAVLVRDHQWKSPGEIPVKMKFLLPNGKELKAFRKTLNEQGATEGNIEISSSAITGSYTLEVYSSHDILLATKNFMIEEFVPDRIRVNAVLDKTSAEPSQALLLKINAMNFFGPPAANKKYELEVQVRQQYFSAKKFPDYHFTLANQRSFFDGVVREGVTDQEGNASETYTIPSIYMNSGLLQASFYATVFDETGRPVSKKATADVYTQDVFHGIRDDGYYYYALNQPIQFDVISVDKNGNAVEAPARVQIIKHEYHTSLVRTGSYFRYVSQTQDKVISDQQMVIGSGTKIPFVPRSPGDYEIRIYRPGANAYVQKRFYSYGSWGSSAGSFEVNNEGHVDIDLDKESYIAGETAKLLFKTPFNGRMLVTVETDKVLSYQYIDVVKKTASLDLKLTSGYVPNIYVTATLFKPHEISDIPLTVAHGFQNIKVEEDGRKIGVSIVSNTKVRSKTTQSVKVKALPGSYVTLAAVDNGVLQVSNFKTPDPYGYYYQKRALQVNPFDIYPLLFPEIRRRLSSTGGDGELDMDKRTNPVQAKRFNILSYWSGIRKANNSGVAEFEFSIPQFSGEVRLMAVAFKDEKFGSADETMTVADPLVLSSALPRFISPGDTVLMPVTVTNTTGKNASGQATVSVSGPVKIVGSNAQQLSVAGNRESQAMFQLVADPVIGAAKISVQVNALGEKFTEETEIAVRPPSTLQKLSGGGSIEGGKTQKVTIPVSDFMAGSVRYELVVSRSPMVELGDQLRYLVQYPYGCTEQTISAAFPQLYYGDFADLMKLKGKENANINVMEAIRKIRMRQLYNGAVTLWDGGGEEHWWTTAYAAHFLIEARKAGFDVENSLLDPMLSYLINRLRSRETITYYYNRDQNKKIAPKEVAYSLYVLSLAGKPQVSVMNYYKANSVLLALDGKYLLSAAYAAAGDKRSYAALLPNSFKGEESVQQTGGSFYSYLRDEAIALNALIDIDPGHAQIPEMVKHVSQMLKSEKYPNTQERVFSLLALGKMARSVGTSDVTAEIRSNGKTIAKVDGNWKGGNDVLPSNTIEIVTKGKGRLYYTWIAEGISTSGAYKEEDNYVRVRRRFFDRNGRLLTGTTFRQNDLIVVEITLEKTYNSRIDNIVITDLLPAGFEIENPRTKEIPGMDWTRDASHPVAIDVRDDRIHFFVDAYSNQHKYYYAVRAVSLGQFRQGPVSADAMYSGEIHSYHGAQTIRVVQ